MDNFQYGKLSKECKAHGPVFRAIEERDIPYQVPYAVGYSIPSKIRQDKTGQDALDVSSAVNRSGGRAQVLGAPPDIQAASMCPHLRRVSDAYPKPNGHRAAYRTWAALIAEGHNAQELADKCVAAIDLYKNSEEWAKDKGAYIPDLASWLDKGRWEDKPTPKLRRGISPEGQKILDKIFEEEQARNAYRRNDT